MKTKELEKAAAAAAKGNDKEVAVTTTKETSVGASATVAKTTTTTAKPTSKPTTTAKTPKPTTTKPTTTAKGTKPDSKPTAVKDMTELELKEMIQATVTEIMTGFTVKGILSEGSGDDSTGKVLEPPKPVKEPESLTIREAFRFRYRENGVLKDGTILGIFAARQAAYDGRIRAVMVWVDQDGKIVRDLTSAEVVKYCS
ncbi:MAG: hypothetical protein Q4B29_02950 [Candidatus Saccharibacteria bacterium]|nr:hypothetical protein [Candidatus Saccharibacteria bacterium]